MKTTCPHCASIFRISPEQLTARDGRVRCGVCEGVFDAGVTLSEEDDFPPLPDLADLAGLEMPPYPEPPARPIQDPVTQIRDDDRAPPMAREQSVIEATIETARPAKPVEPEIPATPRPRSDGSTPGSPRRESKWPRTAARFASIALMVILLAVQILFLLRDPIAAHAPRLRPLLEAACDTIGCEIRLPHDPDGVQLIASNLQSDPARPGRLELNAELLNRSGTAQRYPPLELTLTDIRNAPVARRILDPADYLQDPQRAAAGLPAGQSLSLAIKLEATTLSASGYRLELVY